MFKKTEVQIELLPNKRPFYVPGDRIRGVLLLRLESSTSFKDIQLKVRCDEYATISTDRSVMDYDFNVGFRQPNFGKRDVKERAIKRDNSIVDLTSYDTSIRHFELTTTIANQQDPTKPTEHDGSLNAGTHEFNFDILIPHTVSSCPPHCPIINRLGIHWTLKAVMHRSGLKKNIRKEVMLPVYPPVYPLDNDFFGALDFGPMTEVSKSQVFSTSRLKATSEFMLNARFGYTKAGLTQPIAICERMQPRFLLMLEAPQRPVFVRTVELQLVTVCLCSLDDNNALETTHEHDSFMGAIKVHEEVSPKLDLTSKVESAFKLKSLQAPAFKAKYIDVRYELKLLIACDIPDHDNVQTMELRSSVDVLDPLTCVEAAQLPKYDG